jgi:hypothetical protein
MLSRQVNDLIRRVRSSASIIKASVEKQIEPGSTELSAAHSAAKNHPD